MRQLKILIGNDYVNILTYRSVFDVIMALLMNEFKLNADILYSLYKQQCYSRF